MRKFISVVFGIVFLFTLPGLFKAFGSDLDPAVLVGECIFSFVMLALSVYFWRSAKKDEE